MAAESPLPWPLRRGEIDPALLTKWRSRRQLGRGPVAALLATHPREAARRIAAGEFGPVSRTAGGRCGGVDRYTAGLRFPEYPCLSEDQMILAGHWVEGLDVAAESVGMKLYHHRSLSIAVVQALRTTCFPVFAVNDAMASRTELIDVADLLLSRCPEVSLAFLAPDRVEAGGGVEVAGWRPIDIDLVGVELDRLYGRFTRKSRMGPLISCLSAESDPG